MKKPSHLTVSALFCLPLLGCAEDPSALVPLTPVTQAAFEAGHADLPEPEFIAAWEEQFGEPEPEATQARAGCNPTMPPDCIGVSSTWTVEVHTGDIENAGTDATVSFNVQYRTPFGSTFFTGDIVLDNQDDNFERGQIDTFHVPRVNYGTPIGVYLLSDGSGNKPGWYPTKVSIKDECSGRGWSGAFAGWIYEGSSYRDLGCGL